MFQVVRLYHISVTWILLSDTIFPPAESSSSNRIPTALATVALNQPELYSIKRSVGLEKASETDGWAFGWSWSQGSSNFEAPGPGVCRHLYWVATVLKPRIKKSSKGPKVCELHPQGRLECCQNAGNRSVISSIRWLPGRSRIHSRITSLFNEIMSLTVGTRTRSMAIKIWN